MNEKNRKLYKKMEKTIEMGFKSAFINHEEHFHSAKRISVAGHTGKKKKQNGMLCGISLIVALVAGNDARVARYSAEDITNEVCSDSRQTHSLSRHH